MTRLDPIEARRARFLKIRTNFTGAAELLHFEHEDMRQALGSVKPRPGEPQHGCEFCWPAQIHARLWVDGGKACCTQCATNPNRKARMPSFARREFH